MYNDGLTDINASHPAPVGVRLGVLIPVEILHVNIRIGAFVVFTFWRETNNGRADLTANYGSS